MVKRFAEKYDGISCEENYHEALMADLDWERFPNLGYTANFRECLSRANSQENYDKFIYSGFHILLKDEIRSVDETMQVLEKYLKLWLLFYTTLNLSEGFIITICAT